jgi:hypothetical protein
MIARVKNASEGIIRAIADEVERVNARCGHTVHDPATSPPSSGAMLFKPRRLNEISSLEFQFPRKRDIQLSWRCYAKWMPACAGMTSC